MTEIPAALVKTLRDRTGAGMMECKAALQEANGDLEEATTILRKRGLAQAAKKSGRATSEGLIGSYIHHGRQDRRARRAQLRVGLRRPHRRFPDAAQGDRPAGRRGEPAVRRVARTSRPTSSTASAAIYRAQMENSGKPPQVIDKIVEGKLGQLLRAGRARSTSRRSAIRRRRSASCCRPRSPSSARTSASPGSCGSRSAKQADRASLVARSPGPI